MELSSYEHSLQIRKEDAGRVKPKEDKPQTAQEERTARWKAAQEARQVRKYYEQMVLKRQEDPSLISLTLDARQPVRSE